MIYFVKQGRTGAIKIGYTNGDVKVRLAALQTASPERLILLGCVEGNRDTEKQPHQFFSAHKLNGEWYKPSKFIMDYILGAILNKDIKHVYLDYFNFKGKTLNEIMEPIEKEIITKTLRECKNNKALSAKRLGLTRPTLYSKIAKHKINV